MDAWRRLGARWRSNAGVMTDPVTHQSGGVNHWEWNAKRAIDAAPPFSKQFKPNFNMKKDLHAHTEAGVLMVMLLGAERHR